MTLTDLVPGAAQAKLIGIGLLAVALFAGGWAANGWRLNNRIADMKTAQAQQDAANAHQNALALSKAMTDAYGQAQRDDALRASQVHAVTTIQAATATAKTEIRYVKVPSACDHLGPDWVRHVNAAADRVRTLAANAPGAASGGHGPASPAGAAP